MDRDDPTKPEFASWDSYGKFAQRVRHARRYVWGDDVQAFLDTVRATVRDRDRRVSAGAIFYRAQLDVIYETILDEEGNESGFEIRAHGPERMKPRSYRASQGRINPAGIPVLYLGNTVQSAISEVRPWIGSEVSVSQFKIVRDLRMIDVTPGYGQMAIGHLTFDHLMGVNEPTATEKEKAVWIELDNAFSRPVTTSDDTADYVPTQILAELFQEAGYDAVVYRSRFGENGHNIALFNVADAEPINGMPYQITSVDIKFEEMGNPWSKRRASEAP